MEQDLSPEVDLLLLKAQAMYVYWLYKENRPTRIANCMDFPKNTAVALMRLQLIMDEKADEQFYAKYKPRQKRNGSDVKIRWVNVQVSQKPVLPIFS